jgi:hypothetical protein
MAIFPSFTPFKLDVGAKSEEPHFQQEKLKEAV